MESRSYFIVGLIAWALINPSNAKHSLQHKQDVALEHVMTADDATFVRQLKKAMRLNSKYIKKLKHRQDTDLNLLLEKAVAYDEQLHSKNASRESIIAKLKEQNAILQIIDQRIRLKPADIVQTTPPNSAPILISGKISVGQTDHSPAKKIKQTEDFFEPTIAVPMDTGRRVGIDKLIEEE